jgi:hypothetical protein
MRRAKVLERLVLRDPLCAVGGVCGVPLRKSNAWYERGWVGGQAGADTP